MNVQHRKPSFFSSLSRWFSPSRCKTAHAVARRPFRKTRLGVETLEGRELPAAGIQEQYMLELVNRMRAAPQNELPILMAQPDVQQALTFFNVNTTVLTQQFAALTPQAPLAWNDNLALAALNHTNLMLQFDTQSHQLPGEASLGDRITAAGYAWQGVGENAFTNAQSVSNGHAAFAIDWGLGPNGIQNPAGHRDNIMSANFTDVGIGLVNGTAGKKSGPLLITQNFGKPQAGNPYIVGVVYNDANNNRMYDVGEGLPNVDIVIAPQGGGGAPIAMKTSAAGYYQAQVPAGTYDVQGTGGGLVANITKTVTVGTVNVKADLITAPGAANVPAQFSLQSPISAKEDVGSMQVKVTRDGDKTVAADVAFTVTPGTATTANYIVITNSPLSFAANETEKIITINIVNKPNVFTGDLNFNIALSNPTNGATLLNAKTTATIIDNDAAPKFTLSLVNAPNGEIAENAGTLKVKVAYTGAGGTVKISTADGTGSQPADYTKVDKTLNFAAAGEQTVEIPIIDNTKVDGDRSLQVKLSNPTLGTLDNPSLIFVTIKDDDKPQAANTATLSGPAEILKSTTGLYLITRTNTAAAGSVRVKTSGGTAVAGTDYKAIDQVITFAANESVKTFLLEPTGKSTGDKTVNLVLSDFTGMTAGTPTQLTVKIKDMVVAPNPNAPVGVADFFDMLQGDASTTGTSVLTNDTNGATQAKILKQPATGTVTVNADGTFTYKPNYATFPGFDSFTYQPTNGNDVGSETKVTIMTHQGLQVRKLYLQVLGREPDEGGWQFWTKQLTAGTATLGTVASGIFESPERLDPIIAGYYTTYLGRTASPPEIAYWRGIWQRDGGPENVVSGMIASPEFYAASGGTDPLWVTQVYVKLLGRQPEPDGLTYWTGKLATGTSRQDVVLGFINSPENRALLSVTWYQQYLGRKPTSAETKSVVDRMAAGASQRTIQISIIDSTEYLNTPPPPATGTAVRVS